MTTLAEHMIVAGADNRPPMLEKSMYNSWQNLDGVIRTKKYEELKDAEKLQDDCDVKATNIILQELSPEVYSLVNHHHSLHDYDMHTIGMTMQHVQINAKFLNTLPPEWSKFVTNVKLARNLHTTNYDQLYSYLSQHEAHANEVRLMRERFPDLLALITNQSQIHSYRNNRQPQYNSTYYQQESSSVLPFSTPFTVL
ncbi:hypothetical protein Tco_1184851 [Tanacetum coccineum]